MPRPKGLAKTGGRSTGTPNRRTTEFTNKLEALGVDVLSDIVFLLPKLPPDRRVTILIALLPYTYPKRASDAEMSLEEEISSIDTDTLVSRAKEMLADLESSLEPLPTEDTDPARL